MNNLKTRISIFFDYVRDFVVFIVLTIFIIVFLSTILHNVIKIVELSNKYSGKYKNLVEIENGDLLNVYTVGDGSKTIVILSGYGVQSPVMMYRNLAERLKENYRVAIIEYPGYGFASNTENERTNENIATDIKQALEKSEINGPYILMPHSISNMYAMKFVDMYPESVEAVVSIDGMYPEIINEQAGKKNIDDTVKNVKIASILEYTGFARIISYVKPDIFYIDLMENDEYIKEEDIKLYRKMIATNYLSKTMVNEIKNAEENMKELADYKYPDNLRVLQILASDTSREYDETYSKNKLKNLAQNTISNAEIQKVVQIDGGHMLSLSNPAEILSYVNQFLNQ